MTNKKTHIVFIGMLMLSILHVAAQDQKIADSLAIIYEQNNLDGTEKLELLRNLAFNESRDLKKGVTYAEELISLSETAGDKTYLRRGYSLKGNKERLLGNLDKALAAYFKSAEIAKTTKLAKGEAEAYGAIADTYSIAENHGNAMIYYNRAISILRRSNADSGILASIISNAGDEYLVIKNYDSALIYFNEAEVIFDKLNHLTGKGYSMGNIGMVYANTGKNELAESKMKQAIEILTETQDYYPICVYLTSIADVYLNRGDQNTAMRYTSRSLELAERYGLKEQIADASLKLSTLYEKSGSTEAAFGLYKKHIIYRDSMTNIKAVQKMGDLRTDYEVSQKQQEVNMLNRQKKNDRNLAISLGMILLLTIVILAILVKNYQGKKKAYQVLNLQKQETEAQKKKVENTLVELQLAQKQLIQTAKLASLGELTVGVAHEIQNPLNFVTNFSEVSVEILNELKVGMLNKLNASDKSEADALINDLTDNLKKINNHGKRADSIVKGMLQHSMASTGKKEPTNFNSLIEEYYRLSYNGFRTKDKEFKVSLIKNLDDRLETVDVVPQDIGRVLLNLYNNAFYSLKEKKNLGEDFFEPAISISTKLVGSRVELSIKDNGRGIPHKVLDKIFQPFFTTKPSGQGTGLGLSLSYDIVNAHDGEIKVNSKEGEFAEFIIWLPLGKAKDS